MDDSEAQERISALFGLIKGINPHDEKLTNQEKLDLIFGGRDEKLEEIRKIVNEITSHETVWLLQQLEKIKKILEK